MGKSTEEQNLVVDNKHNVTKSKLKKVLLATGIGHFIEWFDFGLYGTLSLIISTQFFSGEDPTLALMSTFMVFGAGFIMRPLGGGFTLVP